MGHGYPCISKKLKILRRHTQVAIKCKRRMVNLQSEGQLVNIMECRLTWSLNKHIMQIWSISRVSQELYRMRRLKSGFPPKSPLLSSQDILDKCFRWILVKKSHYKKKKATIWVLVPWIQCSTGSQCFAYSFTCYCMWWHFVYSWNDRNAWVYRQSSSTV